MVYHYFINKILLLYISMWFWGQWPYVWGIRSWNQIVEEMLLDIIESNDVKASLCQSWIHELRRYMMKDYTLMACAVVIWRVRLWYTTRWNAPIYGQGSSAFDDLITLTPMALQGWMDAL